MTLFLAGMFALMAMVKRSDEQAEKIIREL